MEAKYLAIFVAVCIFVGVVDLIRREKLTFQYGIGWMAASLAAIFFAVFDGALEALAKLFGFQLASNFVFFLILGALVFMTLIMTLFLCRQNRRNDRMAQTIGMLELEIDKLRRKDRPE
jgi:hypothetical protein